VEGPLENIENRINTIKENATKSNKNADNFQTIMLTHKNVKDDKSSSNDENRFPLSESIEQIGAIYKE
jgi:hypothetical protein